jgi:hypothetical protein
MTEDNTTLCAKVEDHLSDILDGSASDELYDHVADCDRCRDVRYEAERLTAVVASAGADYVPQDDLESRVLAELERRGGGADVAPQERNTTAPSGATAASTEAPSAELPSEVPDSAASGEPAGSGPVSSPPVTARMADESKAVTADRHDTLMSEEPKARTEAMPTPEATTEEVAPEAATAPSAPADVRSRIDERPKTLAAPSRGKLMLLAGGGLIGLAAAAAAGVLLLRSGGGVLGGSGGDGWSGKVSHVVSASGEKGGLSACTSNDECTPVTSESDVGAGQTLVTDGTTRAQLTMADGTKVTLDHSTRLELSDESSRRAKLTQGALVADVAKVEGQTARFDLPKGYVNVLGTKLAIKLVGDDASVDVSRGKVELVDGEERKVVVRAGEEGRVIAGQPPFVSPAPALGEALAWSEAASAEGEAEDVPARGLGELKAKKPGDKTERSGAVTLTAHAVKVRVAGAMARTEVDETFTNNTDEVLEGIYRFPIPPDAKIERLALEVDGKLEEGAFVDRDRAASIWRGAIVNAAPQLRQQVRDEIVWVPGPWKDPALLEWQRGGRFELRIYPIPKRGARRVVLAYTQMLKPTGGVRRYSYPLPHDPSGSTKVDRFSVDVEVRGHDEAFGVKTSGYQLASSKSGGAERLNMNASSFIPSGDLTLELALPGRDAELSAWAYRPEAKATGKVAANTADPERAGNADDDSAFVALALRPKLPRVRENTKRTFAIVVDASRSMYGESYRRAIAVAEKTVRELDRGDRFTLLACDTSCRTLAGGPQQPSAQSALEARRFLEGSSPEGASDPTAAIAAARSAAQGGGDVRIVYIGDGTPTVGPIRQAYVTRAVEQAVPAGSGTVTTVAIGADSDLDTLSALARGGGGVVLPYVPGQTTAEVAFAVLGASYGTTLQDVSVELPAALTAVAPKRLDTIVAGGEQVVVARMNQEQLEGTVVLRGRVGKESFEQRYPLRLLASSSKGNAFVPRLFAATRIADLERETGAESKKEAIALSSRFDVASRFTSLLVLESQAMFRAFGLDNTRTSHQWTGEEAAEGAVAAGLDEIEDEEDPAGDRAPRGGGRAKGPSGLSAADGADFDGIGATGSGSGGFGLGSKSASAAPNKPAARPRPAPPPASAPAEDPAPFAQSEAKKDKGRDEAFEIQRSSRRPWQPNRGRRMIPMRRVWERKATFEASENAIPSTALPSAITIAEREVEQAPNRRAAVQKLYSLLMLAGDVERAFSTAERWSAKEPLDADALTARADLASRTGDRELAIRILGSVVDVRPDDVAAQQRLARLHRWAGRPDLGCRHSLAIAQIRSGDAKLLAEAVSCARQTGQSPMASDLLAGAEERTKRAAETLVARFDKRVDSLSGDFRVEAKWSGDADLDIALIHPDGHRVSWLGAPTRSVITATDVQSRSQEGLALRGAKTGEYVIEIVRAGGATGGPVRGDVTVSIAGTRKVIPFNLDGTRRTIGVAKLRMQSRLVPVRNFGWR